MANRQVLGKSQYIKFELVSSFSRACMVQCSIVLSTIRKLNIQLEHAMPITLHTSGESLYLSHVAAICLLSGLQTATVVLLLLPRLVPIY